MPKIVLFAFLLQRTILTPLPFMGEPLNASSLVSSVRARLPSALPAATHFCPRPVRYKSWLIAFLSHATLLCCTAVEKDPTRKTMIEAKAIEYMNRAEALKTAVDEGELAR